MSASKTLLSALALGATACVHPGPASNGPESVARAYSSALDEGRIPDAWALSAPLELEQFSARYAEEAVRKRRAAQLARAAEGQPAAPVVLELRAGGWRVIEAPPAVAALADDQQARALVSQFLAAVDAGDFEAVFGSLSAAWRARYTPSRLKDDLASEPAALNRLARIRAALESGRWEAAEPGPRLPLGEGKSLKLAREGGALKVAALE